jgi:hypothetical protein
VFFHTILIDEKEKNWGEREEIVWISTKICNIFFYFIFSNVFNTGLILMYSARINYNDVYKQRKLDFINNSVMILLFVLCLFNIFLVSMN